MGLVFRLCWFLFFCLCLLEEPRIPTTECTVECSMVAVSRLVSSAFISSLPFSSNQVGAPDHVTKRQITQAAVCFGTAEWLKSKGRHFWSAAVSGRRGLQDFGRRCCFGPSVPVSHEVSISSRALGSHVCLVEARRPADWFCHAVTVLDVLETLVLQGPEQGCSRCDGA